MQKRSEITIIVGLFPIIALCCTLKSCTPIQANINCSRVVTIMMLPMVLMATNTHWTTCCKAYGYSAIRNTQFVSPTKVCVCTNMGANSDSTKPMRIDRQRYCHSHLESLSSVDGPERTKNSQNTKNFHH